MLAFKMEPPGIGDWSSECVIKWNIDSSITKFYVILLNPSNSDINDTMSSCEGSSRREFLKLKHL